jgi:hypothetical protein
MGGQEPLLYVDADDPALAEYPLLAKAVEEQPLPLLLVGDEVKSAEGMTIWSLEEHLASLGVEPFASAATKKAG